MKPPAFETVAPDLLNVGDLVMCYAHDDQWERCSARIMGIERIDGPGMYRFGKEKQWTMEYEYRLYLYCRHVSLKRLDATGGPVYRWHCFSWNKVARYLL